MATNETRTRREMERETEAFTAGPGLVMPKSGAAGGVPGAIFGAIVGAAIGILVALMVFNGTAQQIFTTVAFAAGGGIAGFIVGSYARTRRKVEGHGVEADT